jgi:hypothetical protein
VGLWVSSPHPRSPYAVKLQAPYGLEVHLNSGVLSFYCNALHCKQYMYTVTRGFTFSTSQFIKVNLIEKKKKKKFQKIGPQMSHIDVLTVQAPALRILEVRNAKCSCSLICIVQRKVNLDNY